jgi:hypothetical protein
MKLKSITLTKPLSNILFIHFSRHFGVIVLVCIIYFRLPAAAQGVSNLENSPDAPANSSKTDESGIDGPSFGFFFDRFRVTLEKGFRTEAAGPLYYSQEAESGDVTAFPPFFSNYLNPDVESHEEDFLYPLFTDGRYGHERRWQFFQLINGVRGREPDDAKTRQFTIFPLYFEQRSQDTNLNYTAVIPFYGRLKQRLFKDEIYFIMFPAYVETRKRDVVTDNYFFPFVDVRHGDGMAGWQVWPFAGREHKVVTTVTNGFGDAITVPGHDHSFYCWPFYLRQDNGIGSEAHEKFRASIPFYAYSRSSQRDSTTVLWPFFTVIDDRERKYHEWQGPWPFVIYTRGEGKHTSRVFPIFSESHNDTRETDSYAWPVYIYTRLHADPLDQQRKRILFFLYYRYSVKNTETGWERVRLDMWPFFEWHRDFNGNERLQVLAPLEPAVPDNSRIERNWSPLWSVWRAQKSPVAHTSSESLLWNLYRHDSAPEFNKVSLLFGLYQNETRSTNKTVRLLYIPMARSQKK